MGKRKPAHEIRLGRIRAALCANQTEKNETWFSVTVARLYNDGTGWKDSSSFRRDDLPVVAKVMDMAYSWICNQQTALEPEDREQ